jgi:class 3 adenylate cyclase/tetratricopeptide (TPR) repeat protein
MIGCHRCGGRSRAGARFCGACGAVLGSARAGVRKTVTVLFADAPELHGGHDLESRVRLTAAFYDAVREVINAYGGTVERHAGDAVMAVFGIPAARDDDARRAASAALVLLSTQLPGSPTLSIGINTGEVLAGSVEGEEELAVGDPVVVAARLQQHAAPGEILLGPSTVRMLGPGAQLGPERDVTLKGRAGELSVNPLLGLAEHVDGGARGPFVGREAETRMLRAAFDRGLGGQLVQLVTVLGEAGTGKSRLVQELAGAFSEEAVVLTGVCRAYGAGSAWAPLVEAAEQFVGSPLQQAMYSDLTSGLPLLSVLAGKDDNSLSHGEMTLAVTRILHTIARARPLVVVTEDIHNADPALLELMSEVLKRLEGVPLLSICTARPELLEHQPHWGRGLRHVLGLTLRPLAEEPSRQLAQHLLPEDPAGVERIVGPAGGNPLFLEQLAQAYSEGAGTPAHTVAAVLSARLDRLPLETRQVLERAAVIGPAGRVPDLLPLCQGEDSIELELELASLVRRDLLEVADGRFRFASELVREAAMGGLSRDDRAHLHQVRGLVLAAQGANAPAGFHFEQASLLLRQSDPERSSAMGKQAAARLAAAGLRSLTGDLVAAADLLARATALMPADQPRRLALLPELARARMLSGDLDGAASVLEEAVRRTAETGNRELSAHARLARVDLMRTTEPEQAFVQLPALLQEVLPVLEAAQDDRGLSLAFQLQAAGLEYRVRYAAMEDPLEKAVHHAERAGERRLVELAQGLQAGSMFHGPMHLDETRHRLEAMLEHPGSSPSHRAAVEARLAGTLALQGDLAAGRAGIQAVRRVFRDLGRELSALATGLIAGPIELLDDEPDRAVDLLRSATEEMTRRGGRQYSSALASLLAEACWRCSDLAGAAEAVELASSSAGPGAVISQVRWRSVAAKLAATAGRADEALALSADAVRLVSTTDEVTSQGDVLADAAEVQELLGNIGAAQVLLRDAAQRYERKGAVQAVARLSHRMLVPPSSPLTAVPAPLSPAGASRDDVVLVLGPPQRTSPEDADVTPA